MRLSTRESDVYMREYAMRRFIMFVPLMVLFAALVGFVVMSLWNWLMPMIFGLTKISYWQAWGLLILGRLLVGGFRMGNHRPDRRRLRERWTHMSPEERAKFRRGFWGDYAPPDTPAQPGE